MSKQAENVAVTLNDNVEDRKMLLGREKTMNNKHLMRCFLTLNVMYLQCESTGCWIARLDPLASRVLKNSTSLAK